MGEQFLNSALGRVCRGSSLLLMKRQWELGKGMVRLEGGTFWTGRERKSLEVWWVKENRPSDKTIKGAWGRHDGAMWWSECKRVKF